MNELDKWAAEQCGVDIQHSNSWSMNDNIGGLPKFRMYPWTLSDPRCMQVFRERFEIETTRTRGQWAASTTKDIFVFDFGKTIAEAEMACANAIRGKDEKST